MKIKPFCVPHRNHRDNLDNLMMVNSHFIFFMENEKFEIIQMQTLKINNKISRIDSSINIDSKWFDDF